jgi:hypothetical protein
VGTGADLPFIPEGVEIVAGDITRRFGPLAEEVGLRVAHREPAALGVHPG